MMYQVETYDTAGVRYVRLFETLERACMYAEQFSKAYIKSVKVVRGVDV